MNNLKTSVALFFVLQTSSFASGLIDRIDKCFNGQSLFGTTNQYLVSEADDDLGTFEILEVKNLKLSDDSVVAVVPVRLIRLDNKGNYLEYSVGKKNKQRDFRSRLSGYEQIVRAYTFQYKTRDGRTRRGVLRTVSPTSELVMSPSFDSSYNDSFTVVMDRNTRFVIPDYDFPSSSLLSNKSLSEKEVRNLANKAIEGFYSKAKTRKIMDGELKLAAKHPEYISRNELIKEAYQDNWGAYNACFALSSGETRIWLGDYLKRLKTYSKVFER